MIESIEDWQTAILNGSVDFVDQLPTHSPALIEFQTKAISWQACGWNLEKIQDRFGLSEPPYPEDQGCPDKVIVYRSVSLKQGADTYNWTVGEFAQYNGFGYPDPTSGDTGSGPASEVSLTVPVTWSLVISEADSKLDDEDWSATMSVGSAVFYKFAAFCDDHETDYPGYASLAKIRYRVGIPVGYSTSYFSTEWDEVFYSKQWLEWEPLNAAHEQWKVDVETWEAAPNANRGDRPEEPPMPGAEPVKPTRVRRGAWSYRGSDKFSEWHEIARPQQEGIVGIRNLRSVSYRSLWGTKPLFQPGVDRWNG